MLRLDLEGDLRVVAHQYELLVLRREEFKDFYHRGGGLIMGG
jgi:hypothetical protein